MWLCLKTGHPWAPQNLVLHLVHHLNFPINTYWSLDQLGISDHGGCEFTMCHRRSGRSTSGTRDGLRIMDQVANRVNREKKTRSNIITVQSKLDLTIFSESHRSHFSRSISGAPLPPRRRPGSPRWPRSLRHGPLHPPRRFRRFRAGAGGVGQVAQGGAAPGTATSGLSHGPCPANLRGSAARPNILGACQSPTRTWPSLNSI